MPPTLTARKGRGFGPPAPATGTIDPEYDNLIPVRQIAKERTGKTISPSCLWRWIRKGIRGCRLEAVHHSGAWHTTTAAWGRFIAGQTAAAMGADAAPETPAPRSPEKIREMRAAKLIK